MAHYVCACSYMRVKEMNGRFRKIFNKSTIFCCI